MIKKINWDEQPEDAAKEVQNLIDQLVDAVNGILAAQEQYATIYNEDIVPMLTPEVQQKVATMSNLVCPFCQQELKIAGEHTTIMSCFNGDCKGSGLYGEKEFWQELIRTRKVLEIAVDALNKIDKQLMTGIEMTWQARNALEQITALEQKEQQCK